jgi:hypothetical protein
MKNSFIFGKNKYMKTTKKSDLRDYTEGINRLYLLMSLKNNPHKFYLAFRDLQKSAGKMFGSSKIMAKSTFYRKLQGRTFTVIELAMLDGIDLSTSKHFNK